MRDGKTFRDKKQTRIILLNVKAMIHSKFKLQIKLQMTEITLL